MTKKSNITNKKDVELFILGKYPDHIKQLNNIIDLCLSKADDIQKNNPEWIENNDARFAIFGKLISILISTKITMYQSHTFISDKNWVKTYNDNFSILDIKDNFIYIKEQDTLIRFSAFMKFISEFEASLLMIIRHLKNQNIPCENNYKSFVTVTLQLNNYQNLIDIIKFLRNSIHNNGLHIPNDTEYNNITIEYEKLSFQFNKDKEVPLIWTDSLLIFEHLIELIELIVNHDLLNTQEAIQDLVHENEEE